jgi:hypothetical protein
MEKPKRKKSEKVRTDLALAFVFVCIYFRMRFLQFIAFLIASIDTCIVLLCACLWRGRMARLVCMRHWGVGVMCVSTVMYKWNVGETLASIRKTVGTRTREQLKAMSNTNKQKQQKSNRNNVDVWKKNEEEEYVATRKSMMAGKCMGI